MKALDIFAGPRALAHIKAQGLAPSHIAVIPGAAGGPKGLILGPLDRFVFGHWLAGSAQPVHLVGASIGAWRMATACLAQPVAAFARLEHDYIHQHYDLQAGEKRPAVTPGVPTVADSGLPGFNVTIWFGIAVTSATPRPIVNRLADEFNKALQDPEVVARLHQFGATPYWAGPTQFDEVMKLEIAKWGPVVKAAGMTPL